MNKYKQYSIFLISLTLLFSCCIAITTYIVDPFFHYHAPNNKFSYSIYNERYQNDGILRHFDYNAITIGSSMTENFKTSEFDDLFNVKSIKVPFSGGSYKEVNDNLNRAFKYNSNIKYVIRALDLSKFFTDKNYMRYDVEYPQYLSDNNYFNDVKYLLNKSIFINDVLPLIESSKYNRGTITSFNDAYNWNKDYTFGKESVLKSYNREKKHDSVTKLSNQEIKLFQENIQENIVSTIENNPNTLFYYFLTPYSICYWDDLNQKNELEKHIYGEKMIIEALIDYENVYLFSFNDDFDLITNLDNYKDIAHYSEDINTYILNNMSSNYHRINKDNYKQYLDKISTYYTTYDYDSIFE